MKMRLIVLFTLLSSLTACQNYISDQNKQYLAAKAEPPLSIPAKLNDASLSDQQVIIPTLPATNNPVVTAQPSLLPPGSMAEGIKNGTIAPSVLKMPLPDPE